MKSNNGKLLLYYLGDGPGDKNLPEVEMVCSALLQSKDQDTLILSFDLNYPRRQY